MAGMATPHTHTHTHTHSQLANLPTRQPGRQSARDLSECVTEIVQSIDGHTPRAREGGRGRRANTPTHCQIGMEFTHKFQPHPFGWMQGQGEDATSECVSTSQQLTALWRRWK